MSRSLAPASVSVVIPCWNAERWIGETLMSVQAQEHVLETIVVDDGSSDASATVARETGAPGLQVVRQQNQGPSAARRAGTALARAPFVQYLDADDVLMPGALNGRVDALERTGGDVTYSDWIRWRRQPDGSFADDEVVTRTLSARVDVDLLTDAWWPPGALLYRRTIVDRLTWRDDLPIIQDARFLMDAALTGARFVHVPGSGLRYRVHDEGSVSRRDPLAFVDDCFRNACELDDAWRGAGTLDPERSRGLARVYEHVARSFFALDRERFTMAVDRWRAIDPQVAPTERPLTFRWLSGVVGYETAEHVAASVRRIRRAAGGA